MRVGKDLTPPNPSGLCMCGCGETTPVSAKTRLSQGAVKGEHTRFCPRHGSRRERNGSWKGGRRTNRRGYVLVWMPGHHLADRHGYVHEHRLVAEEMLGRRLRRGEVVHHVNLDPGDNRPENLRVMNAADHKGLHAAMKSKACEHRDLERVRGNLYRCAACGMYRKPKGS